MVGRVPEWVDILLLLAPQIQEFDCLVVGQFPVTRLALRLTVHLESKTAFAFESPELSKSQPLPFFRLASHVIQLLTAQLPLANLADSKRRISTPVSLGGHHRCYVICLQELH